MREDSSRQEIDVDFGYGAENASSAMPSGQITSTSSIVDKITSK